MGKDLSGGPTVRFAGKVLLTSGVAASLMMLSPSIASAAYYGSETNYATTAVPGDVDQHWEGSEISGASVYFTALGDWFKVYDTKKDGYSAVVEWRDLDSSRTGACVNKMGADSRGGCNKNFTEGHEIRFRAALYNNGNLVRAASAWSRGFA
ncbi:hypothetical protein [Streptomyces sp. NPDC086838]|uniref:hypothetical protein n=1 Tax=Streptomyces sp. NPDC086838 TaxID=3365762 RepID=UPI00380FA305